MTKYFLSVGLFLCLAGAVSAQTSSKENQTVHITKDTLEGTYELIQNDSKLPADVFTTDILSEIEKNRDEKEIIYIQMGKNTTVKIYPRSAPNTSASPNKKQ